uniref:Uncharacterized protein n=1 Tax=Ascaris lumbricoides TaxID=6252 RepID=A0A0M3HK21_ASCLU
MMAGSIINDNVCSTFYRNVLLFHFTNEINQSLV